MPPVDVASRDRAALTEALANLNAHAKRQPAVIARFNDDKRTKWDQARAKLDDHLTLWELAGVLP